MTSPTLSIVVPLYNERDGVEELVRRTIASCRPLEVPFELVAINDGSKDDTLARLIALGEEMPELRVVDLFRNFGHMPALSAGLSLARGNAVVVMDGDLQDPPELIPRFHTEWHNGADVVYGQRVARHEVLLKRCAIGLFHWLFEHVANIRMPKQTGTFGLLDRRVVDILNALPERHRYFAGLRAWVGGKQVTIPYERPDRKQGKSTVGVRGLLRLAHAAFFSFSKAPLRYGCGSAMAMSLVTSLVGLSRVLGGDGPPSWAWVLFGLGAIGFFQSLGLLVIGEYVALLADEMKARPLFIVREEFVSGKHENRLSHYPPHHMHCSH